jgi:hypothetical protein
MRERRIDGVARCWLMEMRADVVELSGVADFGFTRQAASRIWSDLGRDETRQDETKQNKSTTLCIRTANYNPTHAFHLHLLYASANTSASSTLPTLQISFSSSTSSLDSPSPPAPPSASLRSRAWLASLSATRLK